MRLARNPCPVLWLAWSMGHRVQTLDRWPWRAVSRRCFREDSRLAAHDVTTPLGDVIIRVARRCGVIAPVSCLKLPASAEMLQAAGSD